MKTSEKTLTGVFQYFYWMERIFLFLHKLIRLTCISGLETRAFPRHNFWINWYMNIASQVNHCHLPFFFTALYLLPYLYLYIFLQFLLLLMFPWQWQQKKRLNMLCVFLSSFTQNFGRWQRERNNTTYPSERNASQANNSLCKHEDLPISSYLYAHLQKHLNWEQQL